VKEGGERFKRGTKEKLKGNIFLPLRRGPSVSVVRGLKPRQAGRVPYLAKADLLCITAKGGSRDRVRGLRSGLRNNRLARLTLHRRAKRDEGPRATS